MVKSVLLNDKSKVRSILNLIIESYFWLGEEDHAAELDEVHAKMNLEMEPTKKENKHLMGIIGAAEKGHNLLLNTMQDINKNISGQM